MKKVKKFISTILMVGLVFNTVIPTAFATDVESEAEELYAKTAYLTDLNEYGSNWKNDELTNSESVIDDTLINQTFQGTKITLAASIGNEDIVIEAEPIGKSEDGDVYYFDGSTNSDRYSVLVFSYEKDIVNSSVYFKKYMTENNAHNGNMLKVYLKDNESLTRDYIVWEVFDYELPYNEMLLESMAENSLLGAWFATEFKPLEMDAQIPMPAVEGESFSHTITKSFYDGALYSTHTITLDFICEPPDTMVKGNFSDPIKYTVKVVGKSMNVPGATNLNSSTMSYLHVDDVTLSQISIPNTVWSSTEISGKVHGGSMNLSADFGISVGGLGVSLSFPLTGNFDYTSLNDTHTTYENYNGNYVRAIQTKLADSYALTQINDKFVVESVLNDLAATARTGQVLSTWEITIVNASTLERWTYLYNHNNVFISIL